METGIAQAHLYYACKLYAEYFYEPGEQASNGSATGFIVESPEKNKFGLVTNHHFIEPGWCDARYDGTTLTKLRAKIWTTVAEGVVTDIISEPIFLDDDTIDACILPIRSDKMANVDIYGSPDSPPAWAETKDGSRVDLPIQYAISWQFMQESEKWFGWLTPGEFVFFPGYPQWHDRSQDRPIMRTGAIVSDPQANWRLHDEPARPGDGNDQILFDAFSTDGNSGSPGFVSQRGFKVSPPLEFNGAYHPLILVGINAGHIEDIKSRHVGLSRMHRLSVISALARKL